MARLAHRASVSSPGGVGSLVGREVAGESRAVEHAAAADSVVEAGHALRIPRPPAAALRAVTLRVTDPALSLAFRGGRVHDEIHLPHELEAFHDVLEVAQLGVHEDEELFHRYVLEASKSEKLDVGLTKLEAILCKTRRKRPGG